MPRPDHPLDVEVLQQFRLIFQSVRKHFQSVEKQCGISGSQLWALARIAQQPGQRVTELARAMAIHQSTASNLIEDLVRQGLIRRERSQQDQRAVLLHPTEQGLAIYQRAPQPLRGLLPDALEKLDPAVLHALHAQLDTLIRAMGQDVDPKAKHTPLSDIH